MAEQATWLEFCGWRASARGYSSAVRLYGRVAALSAARAWPPTLSVLDIYVGIFRSAATLSRYLSHLRTVLLWLRCPLCPLADAARVVRGAEKAGRALRRPRVRATAAQTKALAKCCATFGFEDVGGFLGSSTPFLLALRGSAPDRFGGCPCVHINWLRRAEGSRHNLYEEEMLRGACPGSAEVRVPIAGESVVWSVRASVTSQPT